LVILRRWNKNKKTTKEPRRGYITSIRLVTQLLQHSEPTNYTTETHNETVRW
jgi:hypothetical protein